MILWITYVKKYFKKIHKEPESALQAIEDALALNSALHASPKVFNGLS